MNLEEDVNTFTNHLPTIVFAIASSVWKTSQLIDLLEENGKKDYLDYRYGGTGAPRGNLKN